MVKEATLFELPRNGERGGTGGLLCVEMILGVGEEGVVGSCGGVHGSKSFSSKSETKEDAPTGDRGGVFKVRSAW